MKAQIGLMGGNNMSVFDLKTPLEDKDIEKLEIGDKIYISGEVWTCRSKLQRAVFDEGWKLPFDTKKRNLLIHVGPVIKCENGSWKLLSFQPTSSIRFEKWGPKSIEDFGLKAIIGKTTMGKATQIAMKENKCIHATPLGVTPMLFVEKIKVKDVYWYDEMGSIEAAWILELFNLGPFLVDIDTHGNNYFDELDKSILRNKLNVYKQLDIPEDFTYTKLY